MKTSTKTDTVMAAAALMLGIGAGTALAGDAPQLQEFAIDSGGNVVIASSETHQILRVEQGGRVSVLAGTGEAGAGGNGGYATDARFLRPRGVAIDADGSILFGDSGTGRVWRVDSLSGVLSSVDGAATALDEPFIKIKSPNTPQYWYIGMTRSIRWTHNLGRSARFRVEVSRDGGQTWETIAKDVRGKELAWRVTGPPAANARFRVSQQPVYRDLWRKVSAPPPQSDINDADVRLMEMEG